MASKSWNTTAGGAWSLAGNWAEGSAPTAAEDALVTGRATTGLPASDQVVTGPGAAATASFVGGTALQGSYVFGGLNVGTASAAGRLTVATGSAVSAGSAAILFGPLVVSGASSRLTVTGALSIGGRRSSSTFDYPTLAAALGGAVQAASLVLLPVTATVGSGTNEVGQAQVSVDATSSIEIGTAGGVAFGKITVDAGRLLTGAGSLSAGGRGIVDNGTIRAENGELTVADPVSGTGVLQVGAGARLNLTSAAASNVGIGFTGPGGTLKTNLATTGVGNANTFNANGVITGFVLGDVITVFSQVAATTVHYTDGVAGAPGALAVRGPGWSGTLRLAGDFTGRSFAIAPSTSNSGAYDITLQPVFSSTATPSPGTAAPDAYVWSAPSGGGWSDAVDWTDTTAGAAPAGIAPGLNNAVTIGGPASGPAQVIYGPGNSASLTLVGATSLSGIFRTGALAIGTAATPGTLNLLAGSTLAATSATLLYGPLTATGSGTRLAVDGALAVGGARTGTAFVTPVLTVSGGASLQAGSITLAPGRSGAAITGAAGIVLDGSSSIEVGTAGGAATGALTIDAGRSVSGAGSIGAAGGIVDNGSLVASEGELVIAASVRGAGTLAIGAGAALTLASGTAAVPISFGGPGGVLTVMAAAGAFNATGAISGFLGTDRIGITTTGPAPTSASYAPGGTLTVRAGGVVLGTLLLAGDFSYWGFTVAPRAGAADTYDITLRPLPTEPLFDTAYYLARNPDVAAAGLNAYQHFLGIGGRAGLSPGPWFDSAYYLAHNPDVAAAGVNPLQHYEANGWREGRDPSAAFSVRDYLAANPDVAAARIDPLQHWVTNGRTERRAAFAVSAVPPDPLVDAAYYYARNPDVAAAGANATAHYLDRGWQENRNPDAWFDTSYYLAQNPDVRAAGVDPLLHFEAVGWREGRQPSLVFDDAKYLSAYPDIRAAGIDPLLHYLQNGRAENRIAFATGGTAPADPLVDAAYFDRQLGATLLPTGEAAAQQAAWSYDTSGWQRGLNPDAWFDTAYYLGHNPDVAAAHVNPLLHYESSGWREGRDPSAAFSTNKYLAAYADVRAAGLDPLLHYVAYGRGEGRTAFAA